MKSMKKVILMTIITLDYIIEDLEPFYTQYYKDVPNPFRLSDAWVYLTDALPLMQARKDALIDNFDRYYSKYEINGDTYQDFFDDLVTTLVRNADTVERLLEVYDTDIAKPILGRDEVRTLHVSDEGTSDANGQEIDIPADDSSNEAPTSKSSTAQTSTVVHDEEETTHLSDLGVRPNYETLNGFLDANRTIYNVFNSLFKDNFINIRVWKKW